MPRILICSVVLLTIFLGVAFVQSTPASSGILTDPEISGIVSNVDSTRIQNTVLQLQAFGTRQSCSTDAAPGRGVNAARDFIFGQYSAIPGLQVRLDPFVHGNCPTSPTFNVIAWLTGTRHPERLVIIGGHYDSRTINVLDSTSDAPGGNDGGAQTAVVLELARVLATRPHDDTLVFISFAGEEQGLFGSASIAANLTRYFPAPQIVAMLNTDIPGGDNTTNGPAELQHFRLYSPGTPRELRTTDPDGSTDNTSPSRGVMRYVGTWGSAYVPSMTMNAKLREDRPGRASDHRSFINQGDPAVRIMETIECSPSPPDNSCGGPLPCPALPTIPASCRDFTTAHQHSPFDLAQFVTPSYAARIAQVMAATAASLARAPGSPVDFTAQGNSLQGVVLNWGGPNGGGADHFVIAARSVNENFYRQRIAVANSGKSRTFTAQNLGLNSGDSFFISVAAVDSSGHESLFAYPEFRCDSTGCVIPPGALNITAPLPPPPPQKQEDGEND